MFRLRETLRLKAWFHPPHCWLKGFPVGRGAENSTPQEAEGLGSATKRWLRKMKRTQSDNNTPWNMIIYKNNATKMATIKVVNFNKQK